MKTIVMLGFVGAAVASWMLADESISQEDVAARDRSPVQVVAGDHEIAKDVIGKPQPDRLECVGVSQKVYDGVTFDALKLEGTTNPIWRATRRFSPAPLEILPTTGEGLIKDGDRNPGTMDGGVTSFPRTAVPGPVPYARAMCNLADDFTVYGSVSGGICCSYGDGYYNVYYEGGLVGPGDVFGSSETVSDTGGGPPNDHCDTAEAMAVGDTVTGNNDSADGDQPPYCGTPSPGHGVWYAVTGNGNTLTASTCGAGTDFDTKIQVFCDCDPMDCVDGNDDSSCDLRSLQSLVEWCSGAGLTYYIHVGGYGSISGNYELTVTDGVPCSPPACGDCPGGDTCADALAVGWLPFNDSGNTCNCLDDYEEAGVFTCPFISDSPDVVYAYTPAANGCVDATLCTGSAYDTKLMVYEGDCASLFNCDDDACGFTIDYQSELVGLSLTGGTTYYFVVDGYSGDCGDYHIEIAATCGNGTCEAQCGENCSTCEADCPSPEVVVEKWESVKVHDYILSEDPPNDVEVPLEAVDDNFVEPRGGGIEKVVATFSGAVNRTIAEDPANISITGCASGEPVDPGTVSPTLLADDMTLEIAITPALPDQARYTFELLNQQSACGGAVSQHTVRKMIGLVGDVDGSWVVGALDMSDVREASNTDCGMGKGVVFPGCVDPQPVCQSTVCLIRADIDTTGVVGALDMSECRAAGGNYVLPVPCQ